MPGEPLCRVPRHVCNIRRNANPAETCENGRLPRIIQRDTFTLGFRFLSAGAAKRGNVPREPPVLGIFRPS
jgi:hypothetical protein